MTRLAVDLRILHYARSGFFRYGQGLLQALALTAPPADIVLLRMPRQDLRELNVGNWPEIETAAELFRPGEADALRATVARHQIGALHLPFSLFPGRVAPRTMLTVHDLTVINHAETIDAAYRPSYRAAIHNAAHAELVVVPSLAVAHELKRATPAAAPLVLYPYTPLEGFGMARVPAAASTPTPDVPFVLMVGSLEPRKDPLRALAVWEHLRQRAPRVIRLVVVAGHGWLDDAFHAAVAASPYRADIEWRRQADDGEVNALLDRCALFLSLSRYEGFGLPVLEALCAGATVLSTACPSLTEAGVEAGDLVGVDESHQQVAGRAALLLEDPETRARHAQRMLAATTTYYRGQATDRLTCAYEQLLRRPEHQGFSA